MFSKGKLKLVIVGVVAVVVFIFMVVMPAYKDKKARQKALELASQEASMFAVQQETASSKSEDAYLLQIQDNLVKTYGTLPEGYLWQTDGTLLSLGNKNLSAEEVVYAYFNGLRSLDIGLAQKYSRGSLVVDTYSNYFNAENHNSDYYSNFIRNMYKECLLSLQVMGISDVSIFAENKQVFTVKIKMIDLTNKDFWEKDKYSIYKSLYVYSNDESDSTKGEMFLYNYVLGYYKSEDVKYREFDINITVQKYPDLNTGWLVSIDSDLDNACKYTDGTLMINYINSMYLEEGLSYIRDNR